MSNQQEPLSKNARLREIQERFRYAAHDYQRDAARTLIDHIDFELTEAELFILWNADGLAGEVGEAMNTIKKAIWHRHGLEKVTSEEFKSELGDICWYLAALCTSLGFDLGDVMYSNVDKLKKRFPDGYKQELTMDGKRADIDGDNNDGTQ